MSDEMVPIGEILAGLEIMALGQNCVAVDAVVLVRALDEDGEVGWYTRYTTGLQTVDAIGALHAAIVLEEDHLRRIYQPNDGYDE